MQDLHPQPFRIVILRPAAGDFRAAHGASVHRDHGPAVVRVGFDFLPMQIAGQSLAVRTQFDLPAEITAHGHEELMVGLDVILPQLPDGDTAGKGHAFLDRQIRGKVHGGSVVHPHVILFVGEQSVVQKRRDGGIDLLRLGGLDDPGCGFAGVVKHRHKLALAPSRVGIEPPCVVDVLASASRKGDAVSRVGAHRFLHRHDLKLRMGREERVHRHLIFLRGESAGGVDDVSAIPQSAGGIVQNLRLAGGTHSHVFRGPFVDGDLLFAEHALAGAGGVHQHPVEETGEPLCQIIRMFVGHQGVGNRHPFNVPGEDLCPLGIDLIAQQEALSCHPSGDLGGFPTGSGAQIADLPANFFVYLLGAFICGFSVCILNTVVNPMLNLLGGGGNRGNQLVQIGGTFNSLTGTLTPMLVGALIGSVTADTQIADVNTVLYIAMGVFAATFAVLVFVPFVEPEQEKSDATVKSLLKYKHLVYGVIAIFLYVGVEVGIPGTLNFYLTDTLGTANAATTAGFVAGTYWFLMLCGRFISSLISGKVSSKMQLAVTCAVAMILVLSAMFVSPATQSSMPVFTGSAIEMAKVPLSALLLVCCGLCTSVMWGSIFNLSVEGLGKNSALASGLFMTMVVGGGVLPLVQNALVNSADPSTYMTSYWVIVAALAYMLWFALLGSRVKTTK